MILQTVEKESGLVISSAKLLLTQFDAFSKNYFFYTELTDKQVNEITRHEGEELSFFSLKEIEKMKLTDLSKDLLTLCNEQIHESFPPLKHFQSEYILQR